MTRLSGVILIVAGVGLAVQSLQWPVDGAATANRMAQADAVATPPTSADKGRDSTPVHATPNASSPVPSGAATARFAAPPAAPAKPVAVQQPSVGPKALPIHPTAPPPLDRGRLTKELLVQLKRVGCYGGPIGSSWTASARKSMKTFTEYVNATLPVDQPDYILLMMVQSYQGQACGGACPAGQLRAPNGSCLPQTIVSAKKRAPGQRALAAAKVASPAVRPPGRPVGSELGSDRDALSQPPSTALGRMSLAGPRQQSESRPGEQERAKVDTHAPLGSAARRLKRPQQRRHTGTTSTTPRVPRWVPWAQPWAANW
jgi:hypothetical protein